MFQLLTALPFSLPELLSMESDPRTSVDRTSADLSALTPGVSVCVMERQKSWKRFGDEEVGIKVSSDSLTSIRSWLDAVEAFLNGGAQSMDEEESLEANDGLMAEAQSNSGERGPILFLAEA